MQRMRTFLIYALLIAGFWAFSYVMENGFIASMYKPMSGTINHSYIVPGGFLTEFETSSAQGKSTNANGFIKFNLKNTTGEHLDRSYIKTNLYSKQGMLAVTRYYEINNFDKNEERNILMRFKGYELTSYEISFTGDAPEVSYIIDILGYEMDLRDVMGMDLTKHIDVDTLRTGGITAWDWTVALVKSVPIWAYMIAGWIVIWYMPAGFLFGIFPL